MAKELGWSQRALINTFSVEEIYDWMAYERSLSSEFKQRQKEKARVAKNAADEALAIKAMFASMGL